VPDLRWGLTLPFDGVSLRDHAPLLRQAEAAGYDDLWTGETSGPDGFTPLALAAVHTERVRLGTGIVNPFTRGPAVLAQHAAALADLSGGRFVLGLGSSSNVIVERWNGVPFERPLSKVREAVARLRPVLAGERGLGGFHLETPPEHPIPIVLAALRARMLALAAEVADGAFTNLLPLSGARQVAEAFGAPGKELLAAYATVPVYAAYFRWLGWGERLEPMLAAWASGDRRRALELVPDDLLREIFLFGSPEQMHDRLSGFAEAGVTTFVLTPICEPGQLAGIIDALAPGS
jgi:alkanesulfonate monooxygenase SsuD/methylene tetrahydromethanopterin reductase-like flavin-dependent oxidoreductase (luciferase family)